MRISQLDAPNALTSPDAVWFAAVLLLAATAAWILSAGARLQARLCLRLAMASYVAQALATALSFAVAAIAPIVASVAMPALALAVHVSFRRPVKPSTAATFLGGCALLGVASAFSGKILVAEIPQLAALVIMLTIARRGLFRLRPPSVLLTAGALSGGAAALALLSPGAEAVSAQMIFSAAGAMGISLAVVRISDTFVKKTRVTSA